MHIALCDDEETELQLLRTLVKEYDPAIEISTYLSAEELLDSLKTQHCDIVLLDIEMDGMDGFTAAVKLTAMQNPPLIIFVTNSSEYTYRGYEVAFRYLHKPVNYAILADVLSAAIAKISSHKLTVTANGYCHVIPINDILYFETFGHKLVIHTKKNVFECVMKISEAESLLPGNAFASPHKGYLVNLDYVDTVGEDTLSLTCETRIPLSRRRKQEFERALFRFVRRTW